MTRIAFLQAFQLLKNYLLVLEQDFSDIICLLVLAINQIQSAKGPIINIKCRDALWEISSINTLPR